jgi:hypothetical protein
MKWHRAYKQRFGITAARVAVQTHVPWYMRWSLLLAWLGVLAVVAWGSYDLGRDLGGFHSSEAAAEHARLADALSRVESENKTLRDQLAGAERRVQIEQSTHGDLAGQLKALSDENALLKEDLALFQTLMTSGGGSSAGAGGITINRFRVRAEPLQGEYRYQLLVVQARTRGKEFQGRLQLVVDLLKDGEQQVLTLPADGEQREGFDLSFKFYQRIEGAFRVPESAKVTRVQVRVLEDGVEQPRSSQMVVL